MGLDMYLSAHKYVGGWDHSKPEEKAAYATIMKTAGLGEFRCDGSPGITVEVKVAYWRKANQIHAWFVKNVQNGVDDCKGHYVTREQLEELVAVCQRVLDGSEMVTGPVVTSTVYNAEHPDGKDETREGEVFADDRLARELLPTQSGFFFGSTEYNEFYKQDLEDTVEQLRRVLDDGRFRGCDFY